MLEILAQILNLMWDFIPRPVIVAPTQMAFCSLFGKWNRVLGPGLYGVWPVIEVWSSRVVVSQLCETAVLSVSDASGKTWQYRIVVEYEIHDLMLHEIEQYDGQNHLEQVAGSAFLSRIANLSTEELLVTPLPTICEKVKESISEPMLDRGITVLAVRPVMAAQARSFFVSQAERLTA